MRSTDVEIEGEIKVLGPGLQEGKPIESCEG